MSFKARTREELSRRVLGAFIARSPLSDTNQGSVIDTIAQSVGALASNIEYKMENIRDSFDFRNANGTELDARLAELPPGSITRHPAQRARGTVGVILTEGLVVDTIIPEGALFGRTDSPVVYANVEEVLVPAGTRIAELTVEASVLGLEGNAPSGAITVLIDVPTEIISATNARAITTGAEEESDTALIRRALLYLQSLARSQPSALEYMALSADLPNRLQIANIYEDPNMRGYSILYIEDGSGNLNQQRTDGRVPSYTIPEGGLNVLYHDAPAVNEVIPAISVGGVLTDLAPEQYVSIPERGIIYLEASTLTPGDVLTCQPYEVYTGSIATIQSFIEGDPNNPAGAPGFRSAGTRVRVLSPAITRVSLSLQIEVEALVDQALLNQNITEAVTSLLSQLGVNQPLYYASLIDVIMDVEQVRNVHVYRFNTTELLEDYYPPNGSVIRLNQLNISAVEV
jgi:hypothetical protein